MAQLIKADGTIARAEPACPPRFTLEELQGYVGGLVDLVDLGGGYMVINGEGKLEGLPQGATATRLARSHLWFPDDWIAGDVVVCGRDQIEDGPRPEQRA